MPFPFKLMKSRSQQYNVANKDLFVIPIELMTNECIECTLLANSYGQECLNNVCQKIGLHQSDYFGLLFKSKKNVDQWVDLSKPLKKQLDKYATEVKLFFRLQYFVSNFQFLTDEVARNHYYFAMKMLVIEGKIACSRDDAIHLASFSLQAEFGDYSPERHTVEYLNNFALFPKAMLPTKVDKNVLIECAISAYKTLAGVVPSNVAEIYYISEAQAREGYGQEGFPAKDLETGQDVCLGVCIRGIFVINTATNTVELFKWIDIANLIHNKKVFTIERNADSYRRNYSTYDADYASCIWRTCVEQHQYFMKSLPSGQGGSRIPAIHPEEVVMAVPDGGGGLVSNSSDYGHIYMSNGASNNSLATTTIFPTGSEYYSLAVAASNVNDPPNGSFLASSGAAGNNEQLPIDYGRMQRLYDTLSQQHQQQQQPPTSTSVTHHMSKLKLNNGSMDNNQQQQQQQEMRNRSSTEPIDLHHITVNCGTPVEQTEPSQQPPLPPPNPPPPPPPSTTTATTTTAASSTTTATTTTSTTTMTTATASKQPIYENQLDMDEEQKRKLLPAYRYPPTYEAFLKQKYSAMNNLSQSMSSIPSRLLANNNNSSSNMINKSNTGSHGHINSVASSFTSLAQQQPYLNGGQRNAMSTMSVPHLLKQQQQQQQQYQPIAHLIVGGKQGPRSTPTFSGSVYKNYSDLSNLDIDKFGNNNAGYMLNKVAYRGSLPPECPPPPPAADAHKVINQLRYQKAAMQQSGMFTSSSPELNTLQLLQQQQQQQQLNQQQKQQQLYQFHHQAKKSVQFRPEIVGSVKNYPSFFASVPDLTFKSSIYSVNQSHSPDHIGAHTDYKKQAKNRLFGGRNLKIFQRHNTGSEPNLSNNLGGGSSNNGGGGVGYPLQPRFLPAVGGRLTKEQRSNSMSIECGAFNGHLHRHLYSIPNKIDEVPEFGEGGERRRSSVDNVRIMGNGGNYVSIDPNPSSRAAGQTTMTTIASNNSDVTTVRPQPSHIIYVNVNPSNNNIDTSVAAASASPPPNVTTTTVQVTARPELVCINKPLPPNPITTTTSISVNNYQPPPDASTTTITTVVNEHKSNDVNNRTPETTTSTTSLKSSRILVFGRSFEDQDFTREFELLPRMNPEAKFTTASLPENITRNRFRDILPYEENRVKLTPTKDNKHGYINASHVYMTFGTMRQHYIAAQGPLPSTTIDFWQMVYEQSIGLIVMVTNFTESGHQKCHTYLPLSNEPGRNSIRFGDYEIRCNFTSMSNTFITSHLTLTHQGHKPRTVTHLRYTDWTDHSSPSDLQGFLSFLTEIDTIYRAHVRQLVGGGSGSGFGFAAGKLGGKSKSKHKSTGGLDLLASAKQHQQQPPILVHCSAGAGRSGVVILCDALLRCLDVHFNDPIDIPKALIELRYQRMISVQHCVQFRFVCQVLAQYLSNSRLI